MDNVYLVILLALVQFIYFTIRTGIARGKYGVEAPRTQGNEIWERIYRVQQNSMEQLVIFVPGMLAFAHFVSPKWALLLGIIYLLGRQIFSWFYITNPKKRGPGVALSLLSNITLVVGALIGGIMKLV